MPSKIFDVFCHLRDLLLRDDELVLKVREEIAFLRFFVITFKLFSSFVACCPLHPSEVQCSGLVTDSNMPQLWSNFAEPVYYN